MADIKISPQSDDDQNNDQGSNDQETLGGYKFDNTNADKKEIDTDKANTPTPAGMIGAETQQEVGATPEPAQSEPAQAEPAQSEPAQAEPAQSEPAQAEPAQAEPAQTEPAQSKPAQAEPAQTEPAQAEPAQSEPAQAEPAQSEPAQAEPAQTEPAQTEPAQAEPAQSEPAQAEPAQTEPAQTEPAQAEPAQSEPAQAEPAQSEPAQAEPAQAEPAQTEPVKTELAPSEPTSAPVSVPEPETAEPSAETAEPSAEAASTNETVQEAPTQEENTTPAESAVPPKKGLSKPVLIGGALALAVLIGAAAYFGLGGFFKGQTPIVDDHLRPTPIDVVTEETKCPDGEYYNPNTILPISPTNKLENAVKEEPTLDIPKVDSAEISNTVDQPLSAAEYSKAYTMMDNRQPISDDMTLSTDNDKQDELVIDKTEDNALSFDKSSDSKEININKADKKKEPIEITKSDELEVDLVTKEETTEPEDQSEDSTDDETPAPEIDAEWDSNMPSLDMQTQEPEFDVKMCTDIPSNDCELLEQLNESPDKYYLNDTTISMVKEWSVDCKEEPTMESPTMEVPSRQPEMSCGENQKKVDGECQCKEGYIDISPATSSNDTTIDQRRGDSDKFSDINLVEATSEDSSTKPVCVNCQELLELIESKKSETTTADPASRLNDTVGANEQPLRDEIADLESLAKKSGCEIAVEEPTPCEHYASIARKSMDNKDVKTSYDNIVLLIQNNCTRNYNPCEEYLALARAAKKYATISEQISPGSETYFETQYEKNRDAYYKDSTCVDTEALCIEVEENTGNREDTGTQEPSVDLLRVDSAGDRVPKDDMVEFSPAGSDAQTGSSMLSEKALQNSIDDYIDARGIDTDRERSDFLAEYCSTVEEEETAIEEEPAPEREETLPSEETEREPERVSDAVTERDEPESDRIEEEPVQTEPESDRIEEEPVQTAPEPEEPAPGRGSAGGSAIEYNPPVREEPTETSAVVEPEMTASTVIEPEVSASSEETISPAAPGEPVEPSASATPDQPAAPADPELKPAAPSEPTLTPVETPKEPMITEEATPPDIHPVGPEVIMYAFALIASQLYFFRRRILELVMNR